MPAIEVTNKPEASGIETGISSFDESIRVLLIDDQPIVGESVRRLLVHEPNISFRYCADPNQAIDQAKETKATVILQDLVMPEIDGLDLVRRFRASSEAARIPIIVLSTKEDPAIKSQAFEAGADDYLIKLPDKIELVARIRHHSSAYLNQLQRDEAHRALRESQQQLLESNKSLVALNQELETANVEILRSNDRMKKDLEAAARIQAALLPVSFPDVDGIRFAWNFRPCDELAGDSLNVFRLDEQHVGLYLLDVSSHGVPAALLAVMLSKVLSPIVSQSSLLKQYCDSPPGYRLVPPAVVAAQLNQQFPMTPSNGQYFTILYGVLDLQTRVLRYVQAGHPSPILLHADRQVEVLSGEGIPIGFIDDPGYEERQVALSRGDRIFWYSDGITEAKDSNSQEFGEDRLMRMISGLQSQELAASLEGITGEVERWCGLAAVKDDLSLLALEVLESA